MSIRCFLLTPIDRVRVSLRRYARGGEKCAASGIGFHDAEVWIGEESSPADDHGSRDDSHPHDDARWPKTCAYGRPFSEIDEWQCVRERLYQRSDGGPATTPSDAPPGAMHSADYLTEYPEWTGPDGLSLHVKLPNGRVWCIDSRASNCDSPCANCGVAYRDHKPHCDAEKTHRYADARPHKCWVRHGTPPNIHVDKNGLTCNAGAGSIQAGDFHGFLHNGCIT